jgi:hypothetical protein
MTPAVMPNITGGIDIAIFDRYAALIAATQTLLRDAFDIPDITTATASGVVTVCNARFTGSLWFARNLSRSPRNSAITASNAILSLR